MGLTNSSIGIKALDSGLEIIKRSSKDKVIALAGNPNVGKSTVFNALTGMNQHTGNWPGKTVSNAQGYCDSKENSYVMVDISRDIFKDMIVSSLVSEAEKICKDAVKYALALLDHHVNYQKGNRKLEMDIAFGGNTNRLRNYSMHALYLDGPYVCINTYFAHSLPCRCN